MKSRSIVLWAALAVVCAAAAAGMHASPRQSPPSVVSGPVDGPDTGPLVAEGPHADLALLYTGGVVGYVDPCG